ncbi:FtsK/SpoIIIE domain-containing protein [Dictyobacter aurantiacus]|uniref:FtsK domain-containing protein n=1 Tax=Dictyobacter aurantiacus TaxID=1936993 RepID=A0A401ZEY3_9CHLR|nr:FtsK/SpoIIIE domain-containing protein [Dictyobacter aurantiacus]GCE05373.1 hypothetical protein KDAU_27020 [Dictyobacter aurantiacus]
MIPTPTVNKTPQLRLSRSQTLFEAAIERISVAYPKDQARKEGIHSWPDPLPTPTFQRPDPLLLFTPAEDGSRHPEAEPSQPYQAIIPMTRNGMLEHRNRERIKPSMQIPLGLIDKPEEQQVDTFLVDLHGTTEARSGGPLLIAGPQHSGKATALQTMLLWLTTCFLPERLRCAVVDPLGELDQFRALPHFRHPNGETLWTNGGSDEDLTRFIRTINADIQQRHDKFSNQHWDKHTLTQLWSQGLTIPQFLLIISNYQSFAERVSTSSELKRLIQTVAEARLQGYYLILTTTETSARYIAPEVMGACSTKIGLALNEQQRHDLFGHASFPTEAIPGRGLIMTVDRRLHQVQLALPAPGQTESLRDQHLRQEIA